MRVAKHVHKYLTKMLKIRLHTSDSGYCCTLRILVLLPINLDDCFCHHLVNLDCIDKRTNTFVIVLRNACKKLDFVMLVLHMAAAALMARGEVGEHQPEVPTKVVPVMASPEIKIFKPKKT